MSPQRLLQGAKQDLGRGRPPPAKAVGDSQALRLGLRRGEQFPRHHLGQPAAATPGNRHYAERTEELTARLVVGHPPELRLKRVGRGVRLLRPQCGQHALNLAHDLRRALVDLVGRKRHGRGELPLVSRQHRRGPCKREHQLAAGLARDVRPQRSGHECEQNARLALAGAARKLRNPARRRDLLLVRAGYESLRLVGDIRVEPERHERLDRLEPHLRIVIRQGREQHGPLVTRRAGSKGQLAYGRDALRRVRASQSDQLQPLDLLDGEQRLDVRGFDRHRVHHRGQDGQFAPTAKFVLERDRAPGPLFHDDQVRRKAADTECVPHPLKFLRRQRFCGRPQFGRRQQAADAGVAGDRTRDLVRHVHLVRRKPGDPCGDVFRHRVPADETRHGESNCLDHSSASGSSGTAKYDSTRPPGAQQRNQRAGRPAAPIETLTTGEFRANILLSGSTSMT